MRVYLPCTLPMLAALLRTGQLSTGQLSTGKLTTGQSDIAGLRGYAVTPELRESYSSGDLEELEYAAMAHAAKASLRLLHADPRAQPRRVVLAAELPDAAVTDIAGFDEPALVEVTGPVKLRLVVSGHVDDCDAIADIKAAVRALDAADAGDDDALFTVDSAQGHELQWYAAQELAHLAD